MPLIVMAELVAAVHVFAKGTSREDVDARNKRGHDGNYNTFSTAPLPADRTIASVTATPWIA